MHVIERYQRKFPITDEERVKNERKGRGKSEPDGADLAVVAAGDGVRVGDGEDGVDTRRVVAEGVAVVAEGVPVENVHLAVAHARQHLGLLAHQADTVHLRRIHLRLRP